jgi:hypothetical protein
LDTGSQLLGLFRYRQLFLFAKYKPGEPRCGTRKRPRGALIRLHDLAELIAQTQVSTQLVHAGEAGQRLRVDYASGIILRGAFLQLLQHAPVFVQFGGKVWHG